MIGARHLGARGASPASKAHAAPARPRRFGLRAVARLTDGGTVPGASIAGAALPALGRPRPAPAHDSGARAQAPPQRRPRRQRCCCSRPCPRWPPAPRQTPLPRSPPRRRVGAAQARAGRAAAAPGQPGRRALHRRAPTALHPRSGRQRRQPVGQDEARRRGRPCQVGRARARRRRRRCRPCQGPPRRLQQQHLTTCLKTCFACWHPGRREAAEAAKEAAAGAASEAGQQAGSAAGAASSGVRRMLEQLKAKLGQAAGQAGGEGRGATDGTATSVPSQGGRRVQAGRLGWAGWPCARVKQGARSRVLLPLARAQAGPWRLGACWTAARRPPRSRLGSGCWRRRASRWAGAQAKAAEAGLRLQLAAAAPELPGPAHPPARPPARPPSPANHTRPGGPGHGWRGGVRPAAPWPRLPPASGDPGAGRPTRPRHRQGRWPRQRWCQGRFHRCAQRRHRHLLALPGQRAGASQAAGAGLRWQRRRCWRGGAGGAGQRSHPRAKGAAGGRGADEGKVWQAVSTGCEYAEYAESPGSRLQAAWQSLSVGRSQSASCETRRCQRVLGWWEWRLDRLSAMPKHPALRIWQVRGL
jgi:hypothetical protein